MQKLQSRSSVAGQDCKMWMGIIDERWPEVLAFYRQSIWSSTARVTARPRKPWVKQDSYGRVRREQTLEHRAPEKYFAVLHDPKTQKQFAILCWPLHSIASKWYAHAFDLPNRKTCYISDISNIYCWFSVVERSNSCCDTKHRRLASHKNMWLLLKGSEM